MEGVDCVLSWLVEDKIFDKGKIELNGSKFLLGNGYMGYRGTLEEYSKEQLVSCVLSGVYDKVGDAWREPVNAPNGLLTRVYCDGELLSALSCEIERHEQRLDIQNEMHSRETVFKTRGSSSVCIKSERFLSVDNVHLICMKYSIKPASDCEMVIETGVDGDVWDINGPHLKNFVPGIEGNVIFLNALTNELEYKVSVAESISINFGKQLIDIAENSIIRRIALSARAGVEYSFTKFVSVYTSNDGVQSPHKLAVESCLAAMDDGYGNVSAMNRSIWKGRWEKSDVEIKGDDEAQFALRYSIYHLLIIAPTHSDRVSIPARGLSGQVYKGAVFWDTEMFMLQFFIHTNPDIAKNLMKYRCFTLDGARRKASEYGFRGAFYAWESQDTGDDACTHFNVADIFTGRPMRTYFRDKQVHISGDVVYGIWQYYILTGDESILLEGGAEVILECARFFFSYSYYKKEKERYEILDVTGPDEYHERVNNNAFSSMMAKHVLEIALETIELLKSKHVKKYNELINSLEYERDIENIKEMHKLLYVPQPDPESLVIEQFDGYHRLEDISLKEIKSRVINKNEYWGGGNGLATTTGIIKQADVVLMLNIFKDRYSAEVKKANWEYYEPRTEHGSSLSPCVYALLAADIGNSEWGYKYFMKTSTIDLTGDSKQYVGTLYIGGTHPAANGGAWMSAVLGFGGVSTNAEAVSINPKLPSKWESMRFNLVWRGQKFNVLISRDSVQVTSAQENTLSCCFKIKGAEECLKPGQELKCT